MGGEGGWMKPEQLRRKALQETLERRKLEPSSWATRRALQDPELRKGMLKAARERKGREER